ncbi:MAG: flagellar basal body L-ring protein FlgH [Allosphingosinicella sp.]
MRRQVLILAAGLMLVAARDAQPNYEPSFPEAPPPPVANGAIFQASNGYAPLTSGNRAAAVGDVLTVVLVERMQGSSVNGVTTARDGSIGITPPSTGPLSFFQPSDVSMGANNEFDGSGRALQSNQLSGEISVTVAAVLPNGNLIVQGEKSVRINRADEFIRLSGIVRPADINVDNRVASTRIADARIVYSGRGEVARASRQGWLQRFFTIVSPF